MEKQSLHFPHIISANSVQESARLIQERYKEKTGHKLKRSVLLEGLSDALKYSNKKVLESKQGAVCVHKDIPLYLGASFYSIVGSYELESPRVFTGHSESEVLSKIADNLIADVWETQSMYCMEYFIGRIQHSSGLMALLKDSTQYIFSDTPYVNDNEAILSGEFVHDSRFTDFGCLIASRFAEIRSFREDIFKTLVDDCDSIEGSHVVEVVSEGDAQLIQSYLPSVETIMEDGRQITVLKGLVAASPLVVASYHNDLLWSFFVGVDYEVIDKIFTFDNYDYSYEIAHNHGRKLKNAAEEIAVYVTLRLKEEEHIETAISAFLTNSI